MPIYNGQSMAEAIISTLTVNKFLERRPYAEYIPSLATLERTLLAEGSSFEPKRSLSYLPNAVFQELLRYIDGRAFFRTSEGHVGLGPVGSELGSVTLFTFEEDSCADSVS